MMPLSQRSQHRGHMDPMFLLGLGSNAQVIHHAETRVPHDATGVIGAGSLAAAADAACVTSLAPLGRVVSLARRLRHV